MAKKNVDGTFTPDTKDYMNRAVKDAVKGYPTQVSAVPAGDQAAYNEAFAWGAYLKKYLNRDKY